MDNRLLHDYKHIHSLTHTYTQTDRRTDTDQETEKRPHHENTSIFGYERWIHTYRQTERHPTADWETILEMLSISVHIHLHRCIHMYRPETGVGNQHRSINASYIYIRLHACIHTHTDTNRGLGNHHGTS
jgi:hypothetical protein